MKVNNVTKSNKPSLAIVSSYDVLCGNASYSKALKENLEEYFDVEVIPLPSDYDIDENIIYFKKMIEKIKTYDYVNLQLELALYGATKKAIIKNFDMLQKASRNLIITAHRIDIKSKPPTITRILSLTFRFRLRTLLLEIYVSLFQIDLYKKIYSILSKRSKFKANYHVITHTYREKYKLVKNFLLPETNITDYPILFYSKDQKERYKELYDDNTSWKERHGLSQDAKLIGVFGFFGKYKNFSTAIKALNYLPANYHLVIVGGQHPNNIKIHEMDASLKDLLKLLTKDMSNISDRVIFLGSQKEDDDMVRAIKAVDYVVLPYYETGQSASGIASMALELEKKAIFARNMAFMELERYFPNCYETFDIGNYLELKNKILHFDENKLKNLNKQLRHYNAEELAKLYVNICSKLSSNDS